ncbi:Uncharacterised protein [Vibrio cholerae]|nr:Uncharacterised protein [Vibrio cholerae]
MNVHTTSSAVKSLPEWNFTPLRKVKRMVSLSTRCQDSARRGSNSIFCVKRISGSKTMCDSCRVPPDSCSCGSIETGSAS